MELNKNENKLITDYIQTLERIDHLNILKSNYLKNPYLENFILKLSKINKDKKLIEEIINKINYKIISNEDICFSINYYLKLETNEKKKIQNFIYNESEENLMILLKLKTNVILFLVKYIQTYYIISELLYDVSDNEELFYYLYVFIKNNNSKKNNNLKSVKFKITYVLFDDLFDIYMKIYNVLQKNDLLNKNLENEQFDNFTKNIFHPWFNIYKKKIEDNTLDNILQKYEKKKSIFENIICFNTICSN